MTLQTIKKLSDEQVKQFNVEYVSDRRWQHVKKRINREYSDGEFNFLDVGGGNGVFADRVLAQYSKSRGTLIDNSEFLLEHNEANERKTLVCKSVEEIDEVFDEQKFDIIFVNWLLHHLVGSSYRQTRSNIVTCLTGLRRLLTENGSVAIYENIYDGLVFDALPGFMIFQLTSNKAIAPITRKLGANTAGTGVCFLSKKQWEISINNSGLIVESYQNDPTLSLKISRKLLLHVHDLEVGLFWTKSYSH